MTPRTQTLNPPRRAMAGLLATVAVAAAALLAQPVQAMPDGARAGHHADGMRGGQHAAMGLPLGHPRMAERLLESVNATPEQRTQIRSLLEAARGDLQAQREAGRSLRQQQMALFSQPTVDARAAEALRQQMLAQHDTGSKRMTQLMLDVSRVLTPAQRQQLAERMGRQRETMQRHQRERRQMHEHGPDHGAPRPQS